MKIKQILNVLIVFLSFPLHAQDLIFEQPLDKVLLQLAAKDWVSTQTALLTVSVNATLTDSDLVKARTDIMGKLLKIAQGSWQITQFDRSQDSSGLEKLTVAAQVRLPQTALTNVYQLAKDVSKPGSFYTVNGIDFKPDLDEVQASKKKLREKLYALVNDELVRLNKSYPEQHYTVNRLYFTEGGPAPSPMPLAARKLDNVVVNSFASASSAPILVNNELIMQVIVELASNRQTATSGSTQQNGQVGGNA